MKIKIDFVIPQMRDLNISEITERTLEDSSNTNVHTKI